MAVYEDHDIILGAVLGSAVVVLCALIVSLFVMVCSLRKKVKELQAGNLNPTWGKPQLQVQHQQPPPNYQPSADELASRGFQAYQGPPRAKESQQPPQQQAPQQAQPYYNDRYTSATSPGYNSGPPQVNNNFSMGPTSPRGTNQNTRNGQFNSQGGPYNQQGGGYTNQGYQNQGPRGNSSFLETAGKFGDRADQFSNMAGHVSDAAGVLGEFGGDFGEIAGNVGDIAGAMGDFGGDMGDIAGGMGDAAGALNKFGGLGKGKKGKFGF